ncbi:hypothetical protein DBR06_SOUSAS1910028, partial [Sousa chinensis]
AAEPFIPSRGDPARTAGCDRHMAVHGRLDVIEETVEKTVEHLEAEVKGLLAQLEELAWNLPPGPFSLIPDLAEKTVSSSGSRDDSLQGWAAGWGQLLHPHGVAWTSQGGSSSSLGQKWEASSGLTPSVLCPHARGCCSPASDRLSAPEQEPPNSWQ